MKPFKVSIIAALMVGFPVAHAVTVPQVAISHAPSTSTYTLDWYGAAGHTYFIQHSLDLMTWQTMPVIESGANASLSWSIQVTADRTFFRLLASDLPTGGNPEAADFDGDGLSNLAEINLGANPISLDSDRDGMPDAWEYAHGFGLYQNDAAGNPDGDDLTNLAEYLAGTNPAIQDASVSSASLGLIITAP